MNKSTQTRLDRKNKKFFLDNIDKYYEKMWHEAEENKYWGSVIQTDEQKINCCIEMLYLNFWGSFYNPDANRPTCEEIRKSLISKGVI